MLHFTFFMKREQPMFCNKALTLTMVLAQTAVKALGLYRFVGLYIPEGLWRPENSVQNTQNVVKCLNCISHANALCCYCLVAFMFFYSVHLWIGNYCFLCTAHFLGVMI